MASYKDIQGFNIQNLTADPDNVSAVGQIYYNSTTGSFKAVKAGGAPIGTWASGGSLNSNRRGNGAFGVQTSAVTFGGESPGPAPGVTTSSEIYNGTSWSPIASLNNDAYRTSGTGTSGAGKQLAGGNGFSSNVEDYNGTSWSSSTPLTTTRAFYNSATGPQTAAIAIGGAIPTSPFPTGVTANVESWNGSVWTEVNNLNQARVIAAAGTETAALGMTGAGFTTGAPTGFTYFANVEEWNGTSWTEITDVNSPRYSAGGSGTVTSAIVFAGSNPVDASYKTFTEFWNGSSWTEVNNLSTGRAEIGGLTGAPSTVSLAMGGEVPPYTNATEEWTAADFTINTLTTS